MGWERIDNPTPLKPGKMTPEQVAVSSRKAPGGGRYLVIKIGAEVARRGSFVPDTAKCSIMVGNGDEAGKVAIVADAGGGKFAAKKKPDRSYSLTITAAAAEGLFALDFAPFTIKPEMVPMQAGPSVITFAATAEMLAAGE